MKSNERRLCVTKVLDEYNYLTKVRECVTMPLAGPVEPVVCKVGELSGWRCAFVNYWWEGKLRLSWSRSRQQRRAEPKSRPLRELFTLLQVPAFSFLVPARRAVPIRLLMPEFLTQARLLHSAFYEIALALQECYRPKVASREGYLLPTISQFCSGEQGGFLWI